MQYIRPSVSIARGYRPVSRSRKDYPKKKQKSILQINQEIREVLHLKMNDYVYLLDMVDILSVSILQADIPCHQETIYGETYCFPMPDKCVDALEEIRHKNLKMKSSRNFFAAISIGLSIVVLVQALMLLGVM